MDTRNVSPVGSSGKSRWRAVLKPRRTVATPRSAPQRAPTDKHEFVADPRRGSKPNRGCAVDLTLYDLKTGRSVEMPSLYDEMSERAHRSYSGGSAEERRLRDVLRHQMELEGFSVDESEWWHFDYGDWKSYAIQNVPFEAIR
jgi:zinc D-Ala-D-Ala dipeptidase